MCLLQAHDEVSTLQDELSTLGITENRHTKHTVSSLATLVDQLSRFVGTTINALKDEAQQKQQCKLRNYIQLHIHRHKSIHCHDAGINVSILQTTSVQTRFCNGRVSRKRQSLRESFPSHSKKREMTIENGR